MRAATPAGVRRCRPSARAVGRREHRARPSSASRPRGTGARHQPRLPRGHPDECVAGFGPHHGGSGGTATDCRTSARLASSSIKGTAGYTSGVRTRRRLVHVRLPESRACAESLSRAAMRLASRSGETSERPGNVVSRSRRRTTYLAPERLQHSAHIALAAQDLRLQAPDQGVDLRIAVVARRERLDDRAVDEVVQERRAVVAPGRGRLVVVEPGQDDDLAVRRPRLEVRAASLASPAGRARARTAAVGARSASRAPVSRGCA